MGNSLHITELAIFSIEHILFGVETAQIQEILMVKHSDFSDNMESDAPPPFRICRYRQQPLPVFDLRRSLCLASDSAAVLQQSGFSTLVAFYAAGVLAACEVASVEDIIPAAPRFLKSVPAILTRIARETHVWGFYDISGALLPLIDLERVISSQDLGAYLAFLSDVT